MIDPRAGDSAPVWLVLAFLPLSIFLQGWAVSCLWGWFVAPLAGMTVSSWHGVGIFILFRTLRGPSPERDRPVGVRDLLTSFFMPLLVVGVGWAVWMVMQVTG